MNSICDLTATIHGEFTVWEAAKECYRLSEQLNVPVHFIHNDRTYRVSLEVTQIAGPPMPKE